MGLTLNDPGEDSLVLREELENSPNKHKFLTKEEEKKFVGLAKRGDLAARDILIFSNMRRLSWMANALISMYHLEMRKDMIQAGVLGIMGSIASFDESAEVRFWTHAKFYVIKEMKTVLENDSMIVIHRGEARERNKVKKYIKECLAQSGKIPTIRQVMDGLNLSKETILNCLDALRITDSSILFDSDTEVVSDYYTTEEMVLRRQVQDKISVALRQLSPAEQGVIGDIILTDKKKGAGGYKPTQVARLRISGFNQLRDLLEAGGVTTADILC